MLSQPVCSVLIIQFSSMGFSYGCLVYICYSFLIQDAQPISISYFFKKKSDIKQCIFPMTFPLVEYLSKII